MSRSLSARSLATWLFAAPSLASDEATLAARTLHRTAWLMMTTSAVFLLAAGLEQPATMNRRMISVAVVVAACTVALALSRRGLTRLASWLMILAITGIVAVRIWTSGGVGAPATSALIIVVIMAGLLLNAAGAVLVSVMCAAIGLIMFALYDHGLLPPPAVHFSPLGLWLNSCMWLTQAMVFQRLTGAQLRAALRRTEIELETREAAQRRLSLALDAGHIGVWNQDAMSRTMTGDSRLFELYGVPVPPGGSVPYATWAARVHPDDLPTVERALRSRAASTRIDFRIVRPDGVVRHVETCATMLTDTSGRPLQIVGVNADVTERKQVEAERAAALRDLSERVKELRLLHAAARLLQRGRASNRELLQELVDRMPAAWQFPECCEARIAFRDVTVTTAGWRDSPWRQSTAFVTVAGDGTLDVVYLAERPQAHEGPFLAEERSLLDSLAEMLVSYVELREHQDGLARLVETRTQQLQIAKDDAERANLAKTRFLAHMSHEIRTPLNAVLGYAQLLERDPALGGSQHQQVGAILSSGNHLMAVINDVLEMSKIEAGRTTLVVDRVDLRAMLRDLEQMFHAMAAARGNQLAFEIDAELPRAIRGDRAKLRQVAINLLSNAIKFTEHGRITVRATHRRDAARDVFAIAVEDTGCGIDDADQVRIFEMFEQSERGQRVGGSGLGLAISRQLARLMDGDLTVVSAAGRGSAFTFAFAAEVVAGAAAAAGDGGASDRADGGGGELDALPVRIDPRDLPRRVLVVDDQAPDRGLLEALLARVGFEVRTAETGEQAIAVHEAWQPDLVLMDLRMPGIGGVEAIRRLQASGATAVHVAVTGSGLDGAAQDAIAAGAREVILKPYLEGDLLRRIGAQLGIRYACDDGPARRRVETAARVATARIPTARIPPAVTAQLSRLLSAVPHGLRAELLDAVVRARPQRIESLAAQIGEHSAEAAARIRALAQDFNYDGLSAALTAAAAPPITAGG